MSNNNQQLENIRERVLADKKLPLKKTATNLVFGKGNHEADIFFIGEAPGRQEDLKGIPFVGAAGRKLDALLNLIGLNLEQVYIANILKYRPPDNRNPSLEEIRTHTPYLVEQIQVINPRVIATLGNFATRFVLSGFDVGSMGHIPGIGALHGKPRPITVNKHSFIVVPLYHPAAMLYNSSLRKTMEKDFRMMENILGRMH